PGKYITSLRVQLVPKEVLRTISLKPAMSRVLSSAKRTLPERGLNLSNSSLQ
ncbi:hypothetical protein Tco_0562960, partial [Tanacetum coccineum]